MIYREWANSDYLETYRRSGYSFKDDIDEMETPFTKPTLFIMGKQDHFVGYHDSYSILKNYPRATFCILDEAGHDLQIEKSDIGIVFNH